MITNALIILLLVIMWCWNLPDDYLCRKLVWPLRGFILYSGMWHGWNMFAPEPLFVNRRLLAVVQLAGGDTIEWQCEDAGQMNGWQAFLFVRERKLVDNLLSGQMAYLKPAFAEFVAQQYQAQGFDVSQVELVQLRRLVPPPEHWRDVGEFERKVIWTYSPQTPRVKETTPRKMADPKPKTPATMNNGKQDSKRVEAVNA